MRALLFYNDLIKKLLHLASKICLELTDKNPVCFIITDLFSIKFFRTAAQLQELSS